MSKTISGLATKLKPQRALVGIRWLGFPGLLPTWATSHLTSVSILIPISQVKEAMQRIHDRGNIGKLILDVEKTPTPLVSQQQRDPFSSTQEVQAQVEQREIQAAPGPAQETGGGQMILQMRG